MDYIYNKYIEVYIMSKKELYDAVGKLNPQQHTITYRDVSTLGADEPNIITDTNIGGDVNMMPNTINDNNGVVDALMAQASRLENEKNIKNNDKEREMKSMNVDKINGHVLVIGTGAAGCNEASLANAEFTTLAVNTSTDDISDTTTDYTFIIKDSFGSGGDRKRAKTKFIADGDRFMEFYDENFSDKKTVIIVHSGTGGTGAGTAPMMGKVISDNYPDVNVFIFTFVGGIQEHIKAQENMAGVMEELTKTGLNYLLFDNDKYEGSIDKLYKGVNEEALNSMRVIARQGVTPNTRSNIDLIDMQNLYTGNKRMIIVSGNFDRKVSGKCDYEQQILDCLEKSVQIGTYGSPITSYGFFLNVESKLYDAIDENFRKIQDTLGEPYSVFRHLQTKVDNVGFDFSMVLTGLDEAVERYSLINDRIDEYNKRRTSTKTLGDVSKVTIGNEQSSIIVPGETKSTGNKKGEFNKSSFDAFL
jgi:hypothetical protein